MIRVYLRGLLLLCVFSSIEVTNASTSAGDKNTKPNFIFFIADDMSPHMFNNLPQGKGKNLTPNLDRLISEGTFLSNLYVASPVCTPSRYNVLTGNYASRAENIQFLNSTKSNDGQTVIQWNSFISPGKEKTIGHHLGGLGYKTGFVGKNHVVESVSQLVENEKPNLDADPRDPKIKALLEYRYEALQKNIKKSGFDFADSLYHNNPNWLGINALAHQNMDWFTDAGLRFIDTYQKEPFFLYFATTLPHSPTDPEHSWKSDPRITAKGILEKAPNVQPSRDSLEMRVKEAGLEDTGQENLLWLDDALGALVDKLKSVGQLDNTIIVFFNDHGQNAKGTLYQGGIKSQAFVWRKSGFKCGAICDVPVSNIDFMATILELASGENPTKGISDGYSFAPALEGKKYQPRESMYFELGYVRALIKGKYKYLAIRYPEYGKKMTLGGRKKLLEDYNNFRASFGSDAINHDHTLPFGHLEMIPGGGGAEFATYSKKSGIFAPDQLYDLEVDPEELNNLADKPEYQTVLKELKKELVEYIDDLPGDFDI
ncbi:MAG: hypothetical protein COA42_06350 [Alteromonadaceae bacterium]|nr:MAG: hypothetical protein COA42_06350 [Alteromonadaceae bacterium]